MPHAVDRLLPWSLTLLRDPAVRLRLVSNGCGRREVALLERAAAGHDGVSVHIVAGGGKGPLGHGESLNLLFERFDEPLFAMADPDVIASGPFLADLLGPLEGGDALAYTGSPVWVTEADTTVQPGRTFLSANLRAERDGTPLGTTFVAVYRRDLLEPVWRGIPRGFAIQARYMLPPPLRRAIWRRGWRYRWFDTARVVNLALTLSGERLADVEVPQLHHVGGFTKERPHSPRTGTRALLADARELAGSERRMLRAADSVVHRVQMRRWRRSEVRRRATARRDAVRDHVTASLAAIAAGRPSLSPPRTDSAHVDAKVAALTEVMGRSLDPTSAAS
jgi:hypothetical protein